MSVLSCAFCDERVNPSSDPAWEPAGANHECIAKQTGPAQQHSGAAGELSECVYPRRTALLEPPERLLQCVAIAQCLEILLRFGDVARRQLPRLRRLALQCAVY